MQSAGQLSIDLFNIHGEQVRTIFSGRAARSVVKIPFDAADLAGGVYFIRLKTRDTIKTRKIILQ
jgi:hypothetical protein